MKKRATKKSQAEILREYGPFPGIEHVAGVTYDGEHVWFASGDKLNALNPETGKKVRAIDVAAHAGTAFDGRHLFQLSGDRIQKIDPKTGRVVSTIRAPGGAGSGLAWGNIATEKFIKSIPRRARFCALSNPIASSLG